MDMAKQKRVRLWSLPSMRRTRTTAVLFLCFIIGTVCGFLGSVLMEGEGAKVLSRYLAGYLSMEEPTGSAAALFFPMVRFPLLLFLLQFTVLGVFLIPCAVGVRGFLLSFAVSSFVRCYGWRGWAAALVLFGFSASAELAVLFWMAPECLEEAVDRSGGGPLRGWRERLMRPAVCCCVLLMCSIVLYLLRSLQFPVLNWLFGTFQ